MAHSRFEYVKAFEQDTILLPHTYIVVRVDGRGFTQFTDALLAFGESDEYSFVFPRNTTTFGRRAEKFISGIVSLFAASYVRLWPRYFPSTPLLHTPAFDARAVTYPDMRTLVDYLRWRQVDTHINSLYNEAFWALVQKGGCTREEAHKRLSGTVSSQKHEILYSFGINYAKLPVMFRRGTTLVRVADDAAKDELLQRAVRAAAPSVATEPESSASAAADAATSGRPAAAAPVREEVYRVPTDPGVDMPDLGLPAGIIAVYPDFNKDPFLTTFLTPFDNVPASAATVPGAKRKPK